MFATLFVVHTFYSDQELFSTLDLVKWAEEIANGMHFLSLNSVIHRDLATRNILLDSQKIAKICDFGLSKNVENYNKNQYNKKSKLMKQRPIKWMAPESERCNLFSSSSDVWSYGKLSYNFYLFLFALNY